MRCTECGFENDMNAVYCVRCSAPLVSFSNADELGDEVVASTDAQTMPTAFDDANLYDARDPMIAGDAVDVVDVDAITDDATDSQHSADHAVHEKPSSRPELSDDPYEGMQGHYVGHILVPDVSSSIPSMMPEASGRGNVTGNKGLQMARRMVLAIVEIAFIVGVSFLPWATVSSLSADRKTIPEIAIGLIGSIFDFINNPSSDNTSVVLIEALAASVWLSSVYLLARDTYYDIVGQKHVHTGIMTVAAASVVTIGGAYFLGMPKADMLAGFASLFGPEATGDVTLSFWPLIVLGSCLLVLVFAVATDSDQ